jgi:6-phosphofructokinase 1
LGIWGADFYYIIESAVIVCSRLITNGKNIDMKIINDNLPIMEKVLLDPDKYSFNVDRLGDCRFDSPIVGGGDVDDNDRVLLTTDMKHLKSYIENGVEPPSFIKSGASKKIYFDPKRTKAAIVTAGGICPGLNDVIKGIVDVLHFQYGIQSISGIRYGYGGLLSAITMPPIKLTPDIVDRIHEDGGSILGSSRGNGDRVSEIVDTLQRGGIDILFCLGGDGTLRGAGEIAEEIKKRDLKISIVGVPKTIDNDLNFVGRTFGFETAVYETHEIIKAAHIEAHGAYNGIGLVKLMGRDSGFVSAYACLANSVVNFCLIPELEFTMDGPDGLLVALERRFKSGKTHCVIVVAEGAGQNLMSGNAQKDASGNLLKKDIGEFMRDSIKSHFKNISQEVSVKYFDPSYLIRSVPAQGTDAILCRLLACSAVHAAMSGMTNCVAGALNGVYSMVPIELATKERQMIDLDSGLWRAVLGSTRQNDWFQE